MNDLYTTLATDGVGKTKSGKLSNKTIIEHHRLISAILEQAFKEYLVPFNVGNRVYPRKSEKKEINFYTVDKIIAIRETLKKFLLIGKLCYIYF